jgi:pimeloyl-ACP methyl ester carboxylesterase
MQLSANGLRFEVEDHGAPSAEPLVLVMGLGMQLVAWPDDFVAMLVARGFRVIRFDNRDIGLSQHLDHLGVPNIPVVALKAALGLRVAAPYRIADMAADAVGLLDALGIASAHWVGASMGGMILQHIGASHPQRTKSLALLMTTSGARRLPGPSLKVRGALLGRPADPSRVESIVDHYVRLYGLIGSPAYPPEQGPLRERLTRSIKRSYHPAGVARQMVAIAADGDRTPLLGRIAAPTAVLHGRDDALVPVAAGHDLAARIRASTLDVIDGWGHDLPAGVWPRLVERIAANAARAA